MWRADYTDARSRGAATTHLQCSTAILTANGAVNSVYLCVHSHAKRKGNSPDKNK